MYGPFRPARKESRARTSVWMRAALNVTTSISLNTLSRRDADGTTRLDYSDVKITTLPPAKRVYGAEAEAADKKERRMAEMQN